MRLEVLDSLESTVRRTVLNFLSALISGSDLFVTPGFNHLSDVSPRQDDGIAAAVQANILVKVRTGIVNTRVISPYSPLIRERHPPLTMERYELHPDVDVEALKVYMSLCKTEHR